MIYSDAQKADPDHYSQRPSCGLNRTWRSTRNTQFQFEEIMFALAGRRLTGNVRQKMKYASIAFLAFVAFASATAAGEDSPELKAAIRERIKEVRARQEPLAIELEAMLAADTKLTLYSLEPNEDERWAFTGKKNGIDVLRGYPIRGRAVVSGKKEIVEIVRSLIVGIRESDGTVASCFIPHHGLTIERGEKKVDLVICFTCLEGLAFGAYASNQYLVTDTPLTVFNAALEQHKLPLPELPNKAAQTTPGS